MRHVGTSTVPDTQCGFSDTPESPVCGQPSTVRAVIHDTWEGDSDVTACADHAAALLYVAGETHPIDGAS